MKSKKKIFISNQNGFTLIEMMMAIAIIAILSAIAVPNYIRHRNNQQVILAAREIYSTLQSAKMAAIRDNTTINVLFTPGEGSSGAYQVFEDLDGNNDFDAADRGISSGRMPSGINMQSATFFGVANTSRFTPLGLATAGNGTVIVTNGTRTVEIKVNKAGGIRLIVI